MNISPVVKEAWRINDEMNRVLLEHLKLNPELLYLQTPDKNWSVAGYLAHLAGSKKWWGTHLHESEVTALADLYQTQGESFIIEKNIEKIQEIFDQTSQVILGTAEKAPNKGRLPYASLDLYLMHMIVHDAHHRGANFLDA
ncbi:MAG: DinB family protein [Deinococcales bacterium]